MTALADEMTRLFFVLNPPVEEEGSVYIQFIGASPGEGVSTLAREFANVAARLIEGRTLLLDLNLTGGSQFDSFETDEIRIRIGEPGPATDFGGEHHIDEIWTYRGEDDAVPHDPLLTIHPVGELDLYVNRVNRQIVEDMGRPRINNSNQFWKSLGDSFKFIVIDSPSPMVSYDGLAVSKFCDASLLVVSAEHTRRPVAVALRNQILDNEGHIGGVVFNRRRMHIPRFIYRLL